MIDLTLLQAHRTSESPRDGIVEEFLQPTLGEGQCVAVLSRPRGPARPVGWVICHSIALEQVHLARLEVVVARALSAAGFPVLRYQGRGYGDSDELRGIGLSSHLADATDAVRLLRGVAGVERVGVMGARLGGAVAALVADAEGLDLLALWEPATSGAKFMRDFLRQRVLSEMADGISRSGSGIDRIRSELATQGWSDIKGFLLTRAVHDEIARFDLTKDLTRFRGSSLVVSVSKGGGVTPAIVKLSEHLRAMGAECTVDTVRDAKAPEFGQFHFQTIDGGRGKRDTQFQLDHAVAVSMVRWASSLAGAEATPSNAPHVPATSPTQPEVDETATQHAVFVPYGDERLAAILALPREEPRGLVLLVTGIGAPRSHRFQIWAKVARMLAAEGYASIRMDYGGLGDSTGTLEELPLIDAPWREAVEVARFGMRAIGTDRFVVAGNCLGATVSLMIPAELNECVASLGILTRLRDPSATYQLLHRGRRSRLATMVRSNPMLRRVVVRRIRGLKGRALPGVEDQLSRALSHARMMFVYCLDDDDVYTPEVQSLLDQILARLPADQRARFELRILPEGPLARLESLSIQSAVIEAATEWLLRTLPEVLPDLPGRSVPAAEHR